MSARFDASKMSELPLWSQVLVATRMLRRAAKTLLPPAVTATVTGSPGPHEQIDSVCDRLDRAAIHGQLSSAERQAAKHTEETFGNLHAPGHNQRALDTLAMMMHWCIDCAHAADSAQDFPIDATITADLQRVLAQFAAHPGVNSLQITITLAGDLDLVHFACEEIRVGRYNGVTDHVMGRLPPVHALDLNAVATPGRGRVTEADYR